MTEPRWQRLSQVYDAALALAPDARAGFLESACGGDWKLRADVESLLRHGLPSTPAIEAMAAVLARSSAPQVGSRMGPYRIDSLIGEGGMGQVYRARDQQLQRDVAIKVLPPVFALDANRRARFEREARVLASLNHPHIAAIYGLVEGEGHRGLVLELVEGETLAERLQRGAASGAGLPLAEVVGIARQLVEALDAAHERGIVHRDLKPANIKISSDGVVKVLDFGLATAVARDGSGADLTQSPTITVGATGEGVLLGTAPYMSPEQARGQAVDKRTDIWAFGCVLYEMLTGRAAFAGATLADTLAAIVGRDPDWTALPTATPGHVRQLLERCLARNPKGRLRDIGDAHVELDDPPSTPVQTVAPAASGSPRRVALMMPVAAIAAAVIGWTLKPSPAAVTPRALSVAVPVLPEAPPVAFRGLALSADGSRVAYVAAGEGSPSIAVTSLAITRQTKILAGTEGASFPFFSSDGKWIAFYAAGELKKVPADGGAIETIADSSSVGRAGGDGGGGTWTSDDTIVFTWGNGIWRQVSHGGKPVRLTTVDRANGEIVHRSPVVLPDGKTLLYSVWKGPGWEERELVAYRWQTGERKLILKGVGVARYLPTGHLIYTREGTLWAVRFDPVRLTIDPIDAPVAMLDDVREGTNYADYDVALLDGALAYVPQHPDTRKRRPVLVDRDGLSEPLPGFKPAYYQAPTFSRDGRRLALMMTGALTDILIYEIGGANFWRLTTKGSSQDPVWSADGNWIFYRATRAGSRNLFRIPLNLASGEERLTDGNRVQTPTSISSDGMLFFNENRDIWALPVNGDRVPQPILRDQDVESNGRLSPNGRWLAFVSNRSGTPEVYVQSYPDASIRRQVSTSGGNDPTWGGRELFFLSGKKMMSATIRDGSDPVGSTHFLFDTTNYVSGEPVIDFDAHPDGRRFVMIQPARVDPPITHINLVQNWFEYLKQRLPVEP